MQEIQKVICLDNECLAAGKEYYLDKSSIMGDSEGEWSGLIYRDKNCSLLEGNYYLRHFKSFGR